MSARKRAWIAASIACATTIAGCDASEIVPILENYLSQVQADGCMPGCEGACNSCDACDACGDCSACADCADCAACGAVGLPSTPIRDVNGVRQGFQGLHPNRRIANAMQLRLTQTGYTFLNQVVPSILSATLSQVFIPASYGPTGNSPGRVYLELRQASFAAATNCSGNASNGLGAGHDCVRLTSSVYFRTCDNVGGCATGESVQIRLDDVPVLGTLDCRLNLDAARGTFPNGLAFRADFATIPESGALASRAGFSRRVLLDAELTNPNTLEPSDVQVTCPSVVVPWAQAAMLEAATDPGFDASCTCPTPGADCTCTIDPSDTVITVLGDLRDDANAMVDLIAQGFAPLCQPAYAASDCPTGSTYVASGMGVGWPGTCETGSPPVCVAASVGIEGRFSLGAALDVVSPGIDAVFDLLLAFGGHVQTSAGGSNQSLYAGIEAWFGTVDGLAHDPCVPIEHPASAQADCDALGSGWEYELLPNGASTGRCIPRIPIVPLAAALRTNAPPALYGASDPNYELGMALSESVLQYAAWRLWDAGAFCIRFGSRLDPTLDPSLLASALMTPESHRALYLPIVPSTQAPSGPTSVELLLQPQHPPQLVIEDVDDPCEPGVDEVTELDLRFDELRIETSYWRADQYARVGTIETDLHLRAAFEMGAQAASGECPAIAAGDLDVQVPILDFEDARWLPGSPGVGDGDLVPDPGNGRLPVQNGLDAFAGISRRMLAGLDEPVSLQARLDELLRGLGQIMPFRFSAEPDALQTIVQAAPCSGPPYDLGVRGAGTCDYAFVGVYLDTILGAPAFTSEIVDTTVTVNEVQLPSDPALYDVRSPSFGQGQLPSVTITMSGQGGPSGASFEYAYRTSYTGWSAWQSSPTAVIQDPALLLQGRHEVLARARVVGNASAIDRSSARATFFVDRTPPMIALEESPSGQELQAVDVLSATLELRVKGPAGSFGAWTAVPASGVQALTLEGGSLLEVRDESGNVASLAYGMAADAGTPELDAGIDGGEGDAGERDGSVADGGEVSDASAEPDASVVPGDGGVEPVVDGGMPAGKGGCSCDVAGASTNGGALPELATLFGLALVALRARSRRGR